MDFETLKQIIKSAIDEGNNLADIMQLTVDKVYQQGLKDGKDDN